MELLGGKYKHTYGLNLNYFLIITIEELLEMLGMVRFFSAILKYLLSIRNMERVEIHVALSRDNGMSPVIHQENENRLSA